MQTSRETAANEALHRATAELVQQAPVAFALYDRDLRYVWVNDALATMAGIPAADHLGRTLVEMYPGLSNGVLRTLRRVLETGEPALDLDFSEVAADAAEQGRHWLSYCYPVSINSGAGPLLGVASIEVTERAAHERERARLLTEVQAERERLRTILQHMPVGVIIAEAPSGRLIYWNRQVMESAWQQFVASDEVRRFARDRTLHPDGRPYRASEWPLARSLRSGEVVTGEEFTFVRADGSRATFNVNSAPLRDAEGEITAAVLTFIDISRRKAQEDQRRFLAEASNLLAASLDYATTLIRVAELAVPLLGDYCFVDLVHAGAVERVAAAAGAPEDAEHARRLQQRLPESAPSNPVVRVIHDGRSVLIADTGDGSAATDVVGQLDELGVAGIRSLLAVPLVARGRTLGALTFLRVRVGRAYSAEDVEFAENLAGRAAVAIDNARLYAAEQAARAEAEAALAARDEFIAIAAHELRTPLTSAKGYVQVLRRRLQRGTLTPEDSAPILQAAETQLDRLSRLLNALMDISRMADGVLQLRSEPVPLGPFIEDIVALARGPALARPIELTVDNADVEVMLDRERFELVVLNLIENAAKYSPADSPIDVTVSSAPDSVTIAVRDRGIGIPPEEQPHIFDRFRRAGNIDARIAGMGLGLYIVREIVHAHGGTIDVTSEPAAGSTFCVRLPRSTLE